MTTWEVKEINVVLAANVGHDVLVEELEDQGDAVGETKCCDMNSNWLT